MQYALLIYEDETLYGDDKNSPILHEIVAKHRAFSQSLGERRLGGMGLKETAAATTVRTRDGVQTLHDGPFAETKEQLGGFYLIDAPDLDAALAIARQIPLAKDGSVEVRPVMAGG